MNRLHLALVLCAPLPMLAATLFSYGTGALPGTGGILGPVPLDVALQTPSCGQCHSPFGGGAGLRVAMVPTKFVLAKSEQISITTSATGGTAHPQNWGGFVAEASAGAFSAGSNSQIDPTGKNATHLLASQSNNRSWTYGYTAPTAAGLVNLFSVVNTVNGNGLADPSDRWGFQGANAAANTNAPVRVYVNETGIVLRGTACAGGFGIFPVLGGKVVPSVGNGNFALELHGAAPNAATLLLIGANPSFPSIPLDAFGITGCFLHNDLALTFSGTTSPGDATRGDGSLTYTLPIPNDNGFRGVRFQAQSLIVDINSGRQTPVTMSNGVEFTIQ
jgi:hypothetical protein